MKCVWSRGYDDLFPDFYFWSTVRWTKTINTHHIIMHSSGSVVFSANLIHQEICHSRTDSWALRHLITSHDHRELNRTWDLWVFMCERRVSWKLYVWLGDETRWDSSTIFKQKSWEGDQGAAGALHSWGVTPPGGVLGRLLDRHSGGTMAISTTASSLTGG